MRSNTNADRLTAEAAIDRIEAAVHPRASDRRLHSRGAVYDAKFVPSGLIESRTIATHLRSETQAVVRFSNGGNFDADDRAEGVRGMAVKFLVDGHAVADLAAANTPTFPARTPEGFVALLELSSMVKGGMLDKLKAVPKAVSVLVKHREIFKAVRAGLEKPPASFATTRFHGLHAFFLVDADGKRQAFRYRLRPESGVFELTPQQASTLVHDFLTAELDQRLTQGPVVFTLEFQFAEAGDTTVDPTIAWPEERPLVPVGQIIITSRSSDEEHWQQQVFDPTRVAAGVELSDDPVLAFRAHAYATSAERRQRKTEPVFEHD